MQANAKDSETKNNAQQVAQSRRLALRVPPYEPEVAAFVGNSVFKGLSPQNLRMALANHPKLGAAFQAIAHVVLFKLEVSEREREIAIIRTGALTRSEYEWGMHVSIYGEKCNLIKEQIQDVTVKKSWLDLNKELWTEKEQLVIRMVDELHYHSTLSEQTWEAMTKHWPKEQVVELIFSSSVYHMAAFFLNSTAVPLENGSERFPEGVSQAAAPNV